MPVLLHIVRGQSESAYFMNNSSYVYVETALQATRNQAGNTTFAQELSRRLGGAWTINNRGDSYASPPSEPPFPVRWGGTSFVEDWQLPSSDLTPYSGNTDSRLAGKLGATYFASLDSILAAHAAAAGAVLITWYRQTWESSDPEWTFNQVEYARAITLFVGLESAKVAAAAPGKPFRVQVVMPGVTDRGGLNHALMREVHNHLAQNGRRSTRASLSGFDRVPNFYIGSHGAFHTAIGTAYTNDNLAVGQADYAHQSAGSAQRTGAHLALEVARWLAPGTPQEFNTHPTILSAFRATAEPNKVRIRVKITPGNYLVFQGADPAGTDTTVNAGSPSTPIYSHLVFHATAINGTSIPTLLTPTSVNVDNSQRALGWAYVDCTFASAPPAGAFVTMSPSQITPTYSRRTETVATNLKKLLGMYESVTASPTVTAAYEDLLSSPPQPVLPVIPVTNLAILEQDPTPMAIRFTPTVKTARANAIETAVGTSPTLEIRTGPQPTAITDADQGTLLVSITLPSDWATVSAGVLTKAGTWSGTAGAAGNAGHFRLKSSGGTIMADGTVTATGGGGDITASAVAIASGDTVTITSATLTEGN